MVDAVVVSPAVEELAMGLRHVLIIVGVLGTIFAICAVVLTMGYPGITHI